MKKEHQNWFQLLTYKIFSLHVTQFLKPVTQTSQLHYITAKPNFEAWLSYQFCEKMILHLSTHNSIANIQKSVRKQLISCYHTQPVKMPHFFTSASYSLTPLTHTHFFNCYTKFQSSVSFSQNFTLKSMNSSNKMTNASPLLQNETLC